MKQRILILLSICGLTSWVSAQPTFFEITWGNGGNDFTRCVKQHADGSIFVVGFSDSGAWGRFDVSLTRITEQGNIVWTKYYGDSLDQYGNFMEFTYDGKILITGETSTANNGSDWFIYKLDTAGNLLWEQTYGTSLNESMRHVEETFDKGFVFTGFQNDGNGMNDSYFVKTDSLGNIQWERWFGGTDNDYGMMARQLPDSGFVITGDTRSFGAGGYDVGIARLDKNGNTIWDQPYGDSLQNGCQGLTLGGLGNFISFGETEISMFSPFENFIQSISPAGTLNWRITFGGANADAAFAVIENNDLTFTVTGYSNSILPGPLDLQVVRVDTLGNIIWARSYGGFGIDIGYDIMSSNAGGYLICGHNSDSSSTQAYLLHLDQTGLLTGVKEPNFSTAGHVYPNPCTDQCVVELPEMGNGTADLQLWDPQGREISAIVHSRIINNKLIINNLSQFPGLLFGRISTDTGIYHFRVLVR